MRKRYLNQAGLSLIELLIVLAMGTVLMTATISVFVKQERLMRDEMTKTNLRALGRIAMAEMAKEIRRAGFGFLGGSGDGIIAISATSITFLGNINEIMTTMAADANDGDGDFDVFDDSDFADDDKIVIVDPTPGGFTETHVINGNPSSDNIDLEDTLDHDYLAEDGVIVSQYHRLTYAFVAGNNTLTRELDLGGAQTVIGKVSGLIFTYWDAAGGEVTLFANVADIRKIEIQLTMTDINGNSTVSVVFNTDVNIRNMDG